MTSDEAKVVKRHISHALVRVSRRVNAELHEHSARELVALEQALRTALQGIAQIEDGTGSLPARQEDRTFIEAAEAAIPMPVSLRRQGRARS